MERRINYLLIGGIFFAVIVALIAFIMWFGRLGMSSDERFGKYFIQTTYDISGISAKTPIKYKGISIGIVESIAFDSSKVGVVRLNLLIEKSIPIAKGSSLVIDSQGLAGLNYLALKQNPAGEIITPNDEPRLELEQGFFGKLSDKADETLQEVASMLKSVDSLLNEENIYNINRTLFSLNKASAQIAELSKNLNERVQNGQYDIKDILSPTLRQSQKTLQNLDSTIQKASNLIDKFNANPYSTLFGEQKKNTNGRTTK